MKREEFELIEQEAPKLKAAELEPIEPEETELKPGNSLKLNGLSVKKVIRKSMSLIFDVKFCKFCSEKEIYKYGICKDCLSKIEILDSKRIIGDEFICFSAAFYNNYLRDVFTEFKFEQKSAYCDVFAAVLAEYIRRKNELNECSWIGYIPMTGRKEVLRGYNPVLLMAREICEKLNIPLIHILKKTKATKEQNKLSKIDRDINLKGVFRISEDYGFCEVENFDKTINIRHGKVSLEDLKHSRGILLDDFLTSGNTMNEAMHTLHEYGISVFGVTLAVSRLER